MPLYSLIIPFTIFPHSHILCWGTCLGGKSISQNPVDRRWYPDHAAMFAPHAWHHYVISIAWHEDFFVGEEMKAPSFIPGNDLPQEILTIIIKVEMCEGSHTVFLVVLCQLSRDPPAAHFSVPWTFVNNVPDCAMWKIKLFFQLFKQHSAIAGTVYSIAGTRSADEEGRPLFCSSVTHVTATKFPTPFSHILHGHHIRTINCLNFTMNFNWSCPFSPQKPNIWLNVLCPHTHTHTHRTVPIVELRRARKLRSLIYESASI